MVVDMWLVALLACHTTGGNGPAPEPEGVLVREIRVALTLDPDPGDLLTEEPDWIQLDHCGRWSLGEDTLVVYGDPDPELTAVALVNYGGWGSLFSNGGSQELEVDLSGGPVQLAAALLPDDVLYDLREDQEDTGVPGGERTFWYDPNALPSDVIAQEVHVRLPDRRLPVEWREPLPCAR